MAHAPERSGGARVGVGVVVGRGVGVDVGCWQREVLKVHCLVHASLPPVKPRAWQVCPPRSRPSQASPGSRTPLGHFARHGRPVWPL